MVILVTGSDGQLGHCIKDVVSFLDDENEYHFLSKENFDLTNKNQMEQAFRDYGPNIVINCAAYTNVDRIEQEQGTKAVDINGWGVRDLVKICGKYNSYLVHISSDYVFNGKKSIPYKEDATDSGPINKYGLSKLYGEQFALEYDKSIVLRTSWLYSEYGHNFYKTMIDRIENKQFTKVVYDQIGTPTYAKDLAMFIVNELILNEKIFEFRGLYNYSDEGIASWYDFASAIETIFYYFGNYEPVRENYRYIVPITSSEYKSVTKRPKYSVLDKTKVKKDFDVTMPYWMDSLVECMKNDVKIKK